MDLMSLYAMSNMMSSGSSSLDGGISGTQVWMIVATVLAITGGILVYFLFLNKRNEGKFKGFVAWLYNFLSFKNFNLRFLLTITYTMLALYITLTSFNWLVYGSFWMFVEQLVIGNLILRIAYEFILVIYSIYENTKKSQ